jgi:hypothetical protein
MTIWLVTIGSSDVELQHQGQQDWRQQFQSLRTSNRERFSNTQGLGEQKEAQSGNINNRSVLMRILGDIYQDSSLIEEKAFSNLDFPLLEQFITKLEELQKEESEKVEDLKVFVLLTDQSTLFSPDEMRKSECPYWQDTVQLKPVLKWYLKHKLGSSVEPQFLILKPHLESTGEESRPKGIDCWDAMLKEVRDKLNHDFQDIKVQANEKVYVSHQAGTPAISSALQFCSIAKFGDRVQFLVLNREYKDTKLISTAQRLESPEYIRAIKLEQAKQLIRQGEPGAALSLIQGDIAPDLEKELELINARINLRQVEVSSEDDRTEFKPLEAAQRIDDMLDVVELLIKNKKYALAMIALTAAHETFLKAVTKKNLSTFRGSLLNIKYEYSDKGKCKVGTLDFAPNARTQWDNSGLFINSQDNKRIKVSNHQALLIYEKLPNSSAPWLILKWIGKFQRDRDSDLRNQFMHNLRGVTEIDAIKYLTGQPSGQNLEIFKQMGILKVYQTEVQQPFRDALCDTGLRDNDRTENLLEKVLHDLTDRLN